MEEDYREVHFWKYCSSCKHETLEENEYPCFICLNEPLNLYSSKPVKWEEK